MSEETEKKVLEAYDKLKQAQIKAYAAPIINYISKQVLDEAFSALEESLMGPPHLQVKTKPDSDNSEK